MAHTPQSGSGHRAPGSDNAPPARLEEALHEADSARRTLDGLLASLDAGVLILGADGSVEIANTAAGDLMGVALQDLCGASPSQLIEGIALGSQAEVTLERGPSGPQVLHVSRRSLPAEDGREVVVLRQTQAGNPSIDSVHLDALYEIFQTLSVLSHKINNPLTALLGRAQILRARAQADPQVSRAAQVIEESAGRLADLTRELSQVVRRGMQEASAVCGRDVEHPVQ